MDISPLPQQAQTSPRVLPSSELASGPKSVIREDEAEYLRDKIDSLERQISLLSIGLQLVQSNSAILNSGSNNNNVDKLVDTDSTTNAAMQSFDMVKSGNSSSSGSISMWDGPTSSNLFASIEDEISTPVIFTSCRKIHQFKENHHRL